VLGASDWACKSMFFLKSRARQLESKTRLARLEAQKLLARLADQRTLEKVRALEEHRSEGRADLSVGVLVVPLNDESPDIAKAFTALTKDVSTTGIAIVADRCIPTAEALLCLSQAIPREVCFGPQSAIAENWG
jgi:hypothetical protein